MSFRNEERVRNLLRLAIPTVQIEPCMANFACRIRFLFRRTAYSSPCSLEMTYCKNKKMCARLALASGWGFTTNTFPNHLYLHG